MKRLIPLLVLLAAAVLLTWAAAFSQPRTAPRAVALWWTNTPEGTATLWRGSPQAPQAARLWRTDAPILEAALSPDGRSLAVVTDSPGNQCLWLGDLDNGRFRVADLAPGLGGLHWRADGRLAYGRGAPQHLPDDPLTHWQTVLLLLEPTTGVRQTLYVPPLDQPADVAAWDAAGRPVLYFAGELRLNDRSLTTAAPRTILSAPAGEALLWSDGETLFWGTPDAPPARYPLPPWKQRCGFAWFRPPTQVLLCEVDAASPRLHLLVVSQAGTATPLMDALLPDDEFPPAPLAPSPDGRWLAMRRYAGGFYWLQRGTGAWVAPPTAGLAHFIAWEPAP